MKSLFKKKDSRPVQNNILAGKEFLKPVVTVDRITEYSVKSPRLVNNAAHGLAGMVKSIPDVQVPKAPDPEKDPGGYLRSIHAVRERCNLVLQKAKADSLNHFDVDMTKFKDTADYVVSMIKVGSLA